VFLFVQLLDLGDVLAGNQEFDDFDEELFVLYSSQDRFEGCIIEQVGVNTGRLFQG